MSYNLPALAKAAGKRRDVTLRPIVPTASLAQELATILMPAASIWEQNTARIMSGYDPQPIGDALTTDSPEQVTQMVATAAAEFMTRLVIEITPAVRRWAIRAELWHRGRWAGAVKAGTGIDPTLMLTAAPVVEPIEVFVARNVALARNISDQAQGRISDVVLRGYQQRLPAAEVGKEIREATGMARKRANRIAADQNVKLSSALDLERQAEAGLDQYRWRHSGKLHPRATHKARNGELFDLPAPRGDRPGDAPYCGCVAQAYIPLLDEVD